MHRVPLLDRRSFEPAPEADPDVAHDTVEPAERVAALPRLCVRTRPRRRHRRRSPRPRRPSSSTRRAVSAAASAIDIGARDRRAFTRRQHRDRAPVADRRIGIVGTMSPRTHNQNSPPASERSPLARVHEPECTFSRHVTSRGSCARVRRHGPPDRVVLGRNRRPPRPAPLADPAPAVGVGRRHARRLDRDRTRHRSSART